MASHRPQFHRDYFLGKIEMERTEGKHEVWAGAMNPLFCTVPIHKEEITKVNTKK
jgi:hypothetical protein